MDAQTKKVAREAIRQAGYFVEEIWRIFDPLHGEEYVEVLFCGHEYGAPAAPDLPMTAYIRNGHASIGDGW